MWIYLSPHFDDAVLSCGGLIRQQVDGGQRVEIWTVCAGPIPAGPLPPFAAELHTRWGTGLLSVEARRAEDEAACGILGAAGRYFSLPDCIYRRLPDSGAPLVNQNDDLWRPYPPAEAALVDQICDWLRQGLAGQPSGSVHLAAPLSVGGHVDHRLARAGAEQLGLPLWYYADYPYAAQKGFEPRQWLGPGRRAYGRAITPAGLAAWQAGVAAYVSQLSTFWSGPDEMRAAIAAYALTLPGHTHWQRK
jgi:LmbE family N-acetylglucosaminyl deacetylase